ncbi:MAG: DsbA family protein [Tepidiformaceae bacterium]
MDRHRAAAWLAMALCIAAAVSFAACGGDDNAKPTSTAATAAATASTGPAPTKIASTGSSTYDKLIAQMQQIDYPKDLISGTTLGKPDAKVTIQMFEDFTCPHCLEFNAALEQQIVDQLVKTGKAKLEFHYFPLRDSSIPLMVGAACANDQGEFWEYQRRLFIEQARVDAMPADKYSDGMTAAFGDAGLKKYAADLGLDAAKFATCLTSQAPIDTIQADVAITNNLNLPGTPSLIVNGKFLGDNAPSTIDGWVTLVDDASK